MHRPGPYPQVRMWIPLQEYAHGSQKRVTDHNVC